MTTYSRSRKPNFTTKSATVYRMLARPEGAGVADIMATTGWLTPANQLVEGKQQTVRGLSPEQVDLMTQEAERLDREFKLIEQSYGADHLDLVLATAYVASLLDNARVVRHLAQSHADLLQEFQKIAEMQKAA